MENPQLAVYQRPYTHRSDDLNEVIGIMNQHQVELQEGYHERAYVYTGGLAVLSTLDTGSLPSDNVQKLRSEKHVARKCKIRWRRNGRQAVCFRSGAFVDRICRTFRCFSEGPKSTKTIQAGITQLFRFWFSDPKVENLPNMRKMLHMRRRPKVEKSKICRQNVASSAPTEVFRFFNPDSPNVTVDLNFSKNRPWQTNFHPRAQQTPWRTPPMMPVQWSNGCCQRIFPCRG